MPNQARLLGYTIVSATGDVLANVGFESISRQSSGWVLRLSSMPGPRTVITGFAMGRPLAATLSGRDLIVGSPAPFILTVAEDLPAPQPEVR